MSAIECSFTDASFAMFNLFLNNWSVLILISTLLINFTTMSYETYDNLLPFPVASVKYSIITNP